jgi:hypothetical protein
MPDITSPRPSSGQPIATAWGDEVHDQLEGIQVGTVNIPATSGTSATAVVVFPRPYAAPPKVFLALQSVATNSTAHAWISSAGITATQCTIATGRDDAVAFAGANVVAWLAIGTPA